MITILKSIGTFLVSIGELLSNTIVFIRNFLVSTLSFLQQIPIYIAFLRNSLGALPNLLFSFAIAMLMTYLLLRILNRGSSA